MQPKDTALRKRTQISKANRTMFIWIAIASAIVSLAVVISIFLVQKLMFNEKVLAEKSKTVSVLQANNRVIPDLETQVRVLDTNQALAQAKAKEGDQAVQVILDALPSDANWLALGASLQNKLLAGIPGLNLDTLDQIGGQQLAVNSSLQDASASTGENQIMFRFSVIGDQAALKQALTNLERSIRTIDILSLQIESQGGTQIMTVTARAFYEPARVVEPYNKVVRP